MVHFRPHAREIIVKIVYYGTPLGGKTTNLRALYQGYPANTRGELVVVPAGGDRTIFFDFLPVDAGSLRGMHLRVQLYTVPGQVHYNATRQVVLRGVDGVVFVADSQHQAGPANRESWENLKDNLLLQGMTLADLPHVIQYNKRDLPDIFEVEEMDAELNEYGMPFFPAVATEGAGVEETLQSVVRLVTRSLRDRFKVAADDEAAAGRGAAPEPLEDGAGVGAPDVPAGSRVVVFGPSLVEAPAGAGSPAPPFGAPPPPPDDEVTKKVKFTPVPPLRPAPAGSDAAPFGVSEQGAPYRTPDEPLFATPEPSAPPFGPGDDAALFGSQGEGEPQSPDRREEPGTAAAPPSEAAEGSVPEVAPFAEQPLPGTAAPSTPEFTFSAVGEDSAGAAAPPEEEPAVPGVALAADPTPAAGVAPGVPPQEPFRFFAGSRASEQPAAATPVAPPPTAFVAPPASAPAVEAEPLADPFAMGQQEISLGGDDVFHVEPPPPPPAPPEPEPEFGAPPEREPTFEAPPEPVGEPFASLRGRPEVDLLVTAQPAPTAPEPLPPEARREVAGAIQRVVPRALAQYGEVRELELEVPVPAMWVGGRRMTLQLRLTLVPEEDSNDD
jgi:signal recognition particle receptor subunit beta